MKSTLCPHLLPWLKIRPMLFQLQSMKWLLRKFPRPLLTKNPKMNKHLNSVVNTALEVNTVAEVMASGAEEANKESVEFKESVVAAEDTTKAHVRMIWASLPRLAKSPREEEAEAVTVVTVVANVAVIAEVETEVDTEVTVVVNVEVNVDLVKVPVAATVPNRRELLSPLSRPRQLTRFEENEVKEEVGV